MTDTTTIELTPEQAAQYNEWLQAQGLRPPRPIDPSIVGISKVGREDTTHPPSDLGAAGLPDVEKPHHASDEGFADRATTYSEYQLKPVGPDDTLTGNTVLSALPIEDGNYRVPRFQSSYFKRLWDFLGEVPFNGLHGRIVPLAQPSTTQGDPDYDELGYLIRETPGTANQDLGLVI